jgi:hypothetical protein
VSEIRAVQHAADEHGTSGVRMLEVFSAQIEVRQQDPAKVRALKITPVGQGLRVSRAGQ